MKIKKLKKGFTLVELVVVIAIIAILSGVSIAVYTGITDKAKTAADSQIVTQLNTQLKAKSVLEGKNRNCTEAYKDALEVGFDLKSLKPSSGGSYVWDQEKDLFAHIKDNALVTGDSNYTLPSEQYKLWKFVSEVSATEEYSQYLTVSSYDFGTSGITVSSGFDVGQCLNATTIKYVNNTSVAKTNIIIYTNSINTKLEIDAALDTVNHYGIVESVKVIKTADSSYHEYGEAAFVRCASGRVVAESGSTIATVVLEPKGEGATLPAVVQTNGGTIEKKYATSNDVVSANNAATKSDQLALQETEEGVVTKQGDVLDIKEDNQNATEDAINKAKNEAIAESKAELQEECIHNMVDGSCSICGFEGYKWADVVKDSPALTESSPNNYIIENATQLAIFAKMVANSESGLSGITVTLTADLDLKQYLWTPIGLSGKSFSGTFDGNGKTITGLYVNQDSDHGGLFGCVSNSIIKDLTIDGAIVNIQPTGENAYAGILCGEFFTGECNNVKVLNSKLSTSGQYAAAISGHGYAALKSCYVENCTLQATEQVGAISGYKAEGSGEIANNTVKDTTIIANDRAGGIVGKTYDINITNNKVENCTITAKSGVCGGIYGQLMSNGNTYTISDNSIDAVLSGTSTNPLGTLRSDVSEAFVTNLTNCLLRNHWSQKTYSENSFTYSKGSATVTINNYTAQ